VRYLSPFRLYFVISALYFLAFSFARYDVSVMHALAYGLEQAHHAHVAGEDTMHMTASAGMAQGEHALHHVSVMTPATDRVQRHNQAVRQTTNWFLKNQSLITFFLVPIAALLLKLLYYRTRRLYIEHLVFAVHIQSFLFAILLLALLPYARSVTYLLALGCSAVYLYSAMRAVYKQRASTTLIRCGVMLVSYGILMTAAAYFAFLTFYYRLPLWHLTGP
jgi:tetrahydromethanopterin S-methyltransferase subunit C